MTRTRLVRLVALLVIAGRAESTAPGLPENPVPE